MSSANRNRFHLQYSETFTPIVCTLAFRNILETRHKTPLTEANHKDRRAPRNYRAHRHLASLLSYKTSAGSWAFSQPRSNGDGNGRSGNIPYDWQNTYKYPTRLRKHAVNANLPFVGLWVVVSQR